jgi:hypothetical protein
VDVYRGSPIHESVSNWPAFALGRIVKVLALLKATCHEPAAASLCCDQKGCESNARSPLLWLRLFGAVLNSQSGVVTHGCHLRLGITKAASSRADHDYHGNTQFLLRHCAKISWWFFAQICVRFVRDRLSETGGVVGLR